MFPFNPLDFNAFRLSTRLVAALALTLCFAGWIRIGSAQGRTPGDEMTREQRSAAWTVEVETVSRDLGLDAEKRQQLEAAYKASRTRYAKAVSQKFKEGLNNSGDLMEAIGAIRAQERRKLRRSISGFLDQAQSDRVEETLGGFDIIWDFFLYRLSLIDLPKETRIKAEDTFLEYVLEFAKERDMAFKTGDISLIAKSLIPVKQKLDERLGKILPANAYEEWISGTEFLPRKKSD